MSHADHKLKTNYFLPFHSDEYNKFHNLSLSRSTICMEIHQLTRHFVGYQESVLSAKIGLSIKESIGTQHLEEETDHGIFN